VPSLLIALTTFFASIGGAWIAHGNLYSGIIRSADQPLQSMIDKPMFAEP
jgi:hypothetical protein